MEIRRRLITTVGGGGGIRWLLNDSFKDTLTAGNVNGTAATPGPGDRTVVDTNSIISTAGGVLVVNGTPAASDRIHHGTFTHATGLLGIIQITERTAFGSGRAKIGFDDALGPSLNIGIDSQSTISFRIKSGNAAIDTIVFTDPGTWSFAFVQGSTKDYLIGKNGSGNWTLLWIYTSSGSNDYLKILHTANPVDYKADQFRVPQQTWLPTPLAYDTFTDTNGVSLDAHASDTSGPDSQTVASRAWVEQEGDSDIQGNEANQVTANGNSTVSTVDVDEADVVIDLDAIFGVTATSSQAVIMRYSTGPDYWRLNLRTVNNTITIDEIDDGGATERASTIVTIDPNTTYALRAICDGQTIDGFVDGGNKVSYGSASMNETVTVHGHRSVNTTDNWDNFIVFARDSGYSQLDKFIG